MMDISIPWNFQLCWNHENLLLNHHLVKTTDTQPAVLYEADNIYNSQEIYIQSKR